MEAEKPQRKRRRHPRKPIAERDYMFRDEVAEDIGCSGATVDRYANGQIEGLPKLPYIPLGKRARIYRKDAVARWIAQVQELTSRSC